MTHYTGTPQFDTSDPKLTADLVKYTMESRGIPEPQVAPLHNGPQVLTLQAILQAGGQPRKIERLADALALAAGADGCRVSQWGGKLLIEFPKPESERTIFHASQMRAKGSTPWHVPLGMGMDGKAVFLNLADPRTCHAVLGGCTRSGKTNLLHWLLLRLLTQNPRGRLQLLLADPKQFELIPFERALHLIHPPATRAYEIVQLLVWLQDQAVDRARSGVHKPRILLVIDEVKELVDQASEVKGLLASLAQIGAGLGISLIVTTQQPGAKALGDALPNFPCRIIGQVASRTLTYGASGRARSYADELLGKGDMLLVRGNRMLRFQAPLVTEADLEAVPRWESAADVPKLDLPEKVALSAAVDPRGGHNRRKLSDRELGAVKLAVSKGASASDLTHQLNINYERAQRLVDRLGG